MSFNFRLYSENATEREFQGWQYQNQALIGIGINLIENLNTKLQIGASQFSGDSVSFNHQSRYGAHVRLLQNIILHPIFKLHFLAEHLNHNLGPNPYSYSKWVLFGGHYYQLDEFNGSTESYFETLFIPEFNNKTPSVFGRITLNSEVLQKNNFSLKLFTEIAAQNKVDNWSSEYTELRLGTSAHYSDWISARIWYRVWKDHLESRLPNENIQNWGATLTMQYEGDL